MSSDYTLAYGTHATPQDGRCAMEWVSYLAGEPHSDEPVCVSPVLRALCVALNDGLADAPRQRLRPYLTRTIGTAADGLDPARAWMAMDWLIRAYTPAWLQLTELTELNAAARALAERAPVIDETSLHGALAPLDRARRTTRDARARAFREPGRRARPRGPTPWRPGWPVARPPGRAPGRPPGLPPGSPSATSRATGRGPPPAPPPGMRQRSPGGSHP